MKSLKALLSPTRKLTIAVLLMMSTSVLALTPATVPPLDNLDGQPAIAAPNAPSTPVPQQQPPQPAEATKNFASELERLTEENAILQEKEKQAKLKEDIAKHPITPTKNVSGAATDISYSEISVRAIYGVGRSFQAVIYYQGATQTVRPGTDINGDWKVSSISSSTVRIRNGKTEKALSLSAMPKQIDNTPLLRPMPPMMPGNQSQMPVLPTH